MKLFTYFALLLSLSYNALPAGQPQAAERAYVLGVEDSISVHVVDLAELDSKTLGAIHIDHEGNIRLPLAGRIHASGLTVEQLEAQIASRLSGIMNNPEVSVSIAEFR